MAGVNVYEQVSFSSRGFLAQRLHRSSRMRVLVLGLSPGQRMPTHPDRMDTLFLFTEGTGRVIVGEEEQEVKAGAFASVSAGVPRGIEADTQMVVLMVNLV